MPTLPSQLLISGPPPCTSTQRIPTQDNNTKSVITPAYRHGKTKEQSQLPVQAECLLREQWTLAGNMYARDLVVVPGHDDCVKQPP